MGHKAWYIIMIHSSLLRLEIQEVIQSINMACNQCIFKIVNFTPIQDIAAVHSEIENLQQLALSNMSLFIT